MSILYRLVSILYHARSDEVSSRTSFFRRRRFTGSKSPTSRVIHMRVRSVAVAFALTLLPSFVAAQSRAVPTPASVIGFEPGADRKLPEWQQVVAYFKALDAASPRVQLKV